MRAEITFTRVLTGREGRLSNGGFPAESIETVKEAHAAGPPFVPSSLRGKK
jgi:hypothetical protein